MNSWNSDGKNSNLVVRDYKPGATSGLELWGYRHAGVVDVASWYAAQSPDDQKAIRDAVDAGEPLWNGFLTVDTLGKQGCGPEHRWHIKQIGDVRAVRTEALDWYRCELASERTARRKADEERDAATKRIAELETDLRGLRESGAPHHLCGDLLREKSERIAELEAQAHREPNAAACRDAILEVAEILGLPIVSSVRDTPGRVRARLAELAEANKRADTWKVETDRLSRLVVTKNDELAKLRNEEKAEVERLTGELAASREAHAATLGWYRSTKDALTAAQAALATELSKHWEETALTRGKKLVAQGTQLREAQAALARCAAVVNHWRASDPNGLNSMLAAPTDPHTAGEE